MIEFFKEGGWGMWAILFIGIGLLASTGYFAFRPEPRRLGFIGALALSLLFAVVYGLSMALGTVFGALANKDKFPDDILVRVLFEGLKESSRPVTFGFVILTIAGLLLAAGLMRASASPPPRPAGGA